MSDLFQIIAELKKANTLSNDTWDVTFNLNIDPANVAKMVFFKGKTGYLTFKPGEEQISPTEAETPELIAKPKDDTKSPSERLRGAIFVLYTAENKPGLFDDYYRQKMEKMIDFTKSKIDEIKGIK